MADNVVITSGTGVTIATDDDGSAQHQWVKIEYGANNSFNVVTTANGLPVQVMSLPPFPAVLATVTNAGTFAVQVTSLPALGVGSAVAITSLPDLGAGSAVKITSLPPFPAGNIPLPVSGTTIAITSLPDLGLNSFVKVSSLPGVVIISATNAVPVNVVAGGAGNGAILDGSDTSIKASVVSYAQANVLAVRLSDTTGAYVTAGGGQQYADGVASGTATGTIAMGLDGTNIQALACNTSGHLRVEVMSQPAVSIIAVTVSNLASVPLTVSGTTIAITSLPAFPAGNIPLPVSGTTIAITSLPNLGAGSILSINNLTVNDGINTTIGSFPVQIVPANSSWRFTATQTGAGTLLIKDLVASQTAIYITNLVVSNENTAGNIRFIESNTAVAIRPVIERLYVAANGGAVMPFAHPVACDTNCALYCISTTVGNFSVFASGFTAQQASSL